MFSVTKTNEFFYAGAVVVTNRSEVKKGESQCGKGD